MKRLILAAIAAIGLLFPAAAIAQQQGVTWQGSSITAQQGTLTTSGDTVMQALSGGAWATAQFTVKSAGTATATTQVSVDGGKNYFAAPYAKKISASSSNPTVQAISTTTLSTGDTWEVALPANATNFQLLCAGTGTTSTIIVQGGAAYVPGNVVAVLYDVTSGSNAALDTGTLDVSGWATLLHTFTMSGGTPAFTISEVDDGGTTLSALASSITTAFSGGLGAGATIGGVVSTNQVATSAQIPLPRRVRYQSAAITSQTSRIRITARR